MNRHKIWIVQVDLICKECKLKFKVYPCRIRQGARFCSIKCRALYIKSNTRKYKFYCRQCKKSYIIPKKFLKSGKRKYCSYGCRNNSYRNNTRKKHPNWKGGKHKTSQGYISIYIGKGKYKMQHRLVMEKHLGKKLKKDEIVHHINGNKTDNSIENLELMLLRDHMKLHDKDREKNYKGLYT